MKISIASILFTAAIASNAVSAAAPQGKAFDHILQVWFENQVRILNIDASQIIN